MKFQAGKSEKFKIAISYESVFELWQIFPDGKDMPENPTEQDVIDLINPFTSIVEFIKAWQLEQEPEKGDFVVTVTKI